MSIMGKKFFLIIPPSTSSTNIQVQLIFFQIYKTMVVKALDTRQQRTVIPEQWETNKVNPKIVPVYCIKSFQAQRQEREPRKCLENSLSWGDGAGSPGKPKQLGFTGQSSGEERALQKRCSEDVLRIHLTYSVHAHEKTTWVQREQPKKTRVNST